jgi:hypothetical protein
MSRSGLSVAGGESLDRSDQPQPASEVALAVVGCAGAADRRLAVESQLEPDHAGRAFHSASMSRGLGPRI